MIALMIDFANLMLAGLLVGALFGAWLFLNPRGLDAHSYIAVQQQGIRTMNGVMPALGAATILATITAALLRQGDHTRPLLFIAAACFAAIGVITRFLNQPINAVVLTWRAESLPSNWMALRDQWWRWHVMRLVLGLTGLSLLIAAALKRGWGG